MPFRCAFTSSMLVALAILTEGCRWQSSNSTEVKTGEFGSGSGTYTAQCSGDFADWISDHPPIPDATGDVNPSEPGIQQSFQLAQAYPFGIPVLVTDASGQTKVDHWDPPTPNQDAPWRAFTNLSDATQRTNYLSALKTYILDDMSDPSIQFNATKNNSMRPRQWFHVPMMTAAGMKRREPYHGVTAERALRPGEQTHWVNAGPNLKAVAIGYYNSLGGYTIGQVFKSYDLSKTDASKGKFIDGTLVFKLLFAQYDSSRIVGSNPLLNSPAWFVQDPSNSGGPLLEVRLLQVDIAVKDDHFSGTTGWVFTTFVYDESLTASEPNPWRRLTPLGIQWGNDPTITGTAPAVLSETWINPSMPGAFKDHLGRAGRLIGPIDNPASSCLSCHSTAEVDMSQIGNATNILGAAVVPPSGCSDPMNWFRNLPSGPGGSQAFGRAVSTCPVDTSTVGLTSLDYSLQLQEGLQSVFGYQNENPCFNFAKLHHDSVGDAEAAMAKAMAPRQAEKQVILRVQPSALKQIKLERKDNLLSSDNSGDLHQR